MSQIDLNIDVKNMTLSELFTLIEMAAEEYIFRAKNINENISIVAKEEQRLLHVMETSRVGTVEGYKLFDEMRHNRRIRRMIKNDMQFDNSLQQHGCCMGDIYKKLKLGKGKKCSSKEHLNSQRQYMMFEELGEITQSDVAEHINGILPPVDYSLRSLQKSLTKNNTEAKRA